MTFAEEGAYPFNNVFSHGFLLLVRFLLDYF
jgi:hypothetical protein